MSEERQENASKAPAAGSALPFSFADVQWPDLPFDLEKHACLVMRRGSESHGLYIPPEDEMGTDDRDVMVVVIPPQQYVFGLKTWSGTAESIKGPWDVVVYDWRKFISLLVKQNPNVVGMLWLEQEDYLHATWAGRWLLDSREAFRARKPAYTAFVGYANAQLQKMTMGMRAGYMGEKRKKLVIRYGYDTKNATHLIRLLRMGAEYQRTGHLTVRRTTDAAELKAIKQGALKLEEVKALAAAELKLVDAAMDASVLPEGVNEKYINALCYRVACAAYFGGPEQRLPSTSREEREAKRSEPPKAPQKAVEIPAIPDSKG